MKKRIRPHEVLGKPVKLYEKFHEATKVKRFGPETPKELWPEEWKKIGYKGYPRLQETKLPKPKLSSAKSLINVLKKRVSGRSFSGKKIFLDMLSSLLYYSAGEFNIKSQARRLYPSAGARYPLEIYLIIKNSEIENGIYHYYVKNNSLEKIGTYDNTPFSKYTGQNWSDKANCLIIISGVFERTTAKYGDRGYRHVMVEAGIVIENLYLVSAALGLVCCASGGYLDDKINKALDIDGRRESVVGLMVVGA